jgi:outer membrane protein
LAQARKSFEVGASTITDTHEAQARYDLTVAQEIAALNDLEVKRRTLEKIIGGESPELASLRDGVSLSMPEPNKMDAWVRQAEEDGIGVQAEPVRPRIGAARSGTTARRPSPDSGSGGQLQR